MKKKDSHRYWTTDLGDSDQLLQEVRRVDPHHVTRHICGRDNDFLFFLSEPQTSVFNIWIHKNICHGRQMSEISRCKHTQKKKRERKSLPGHFPSVTGREQHLTGQGMSQCETVLTQEIKLGSRSGVRGLRVCVSQQNRLPSAAITTRVPGRFILKNHSETRRLVRGLPPWELYCTV